MPGTVNIFGLLSREPAHIRGVIPSHSGFEVVEEEDEPSKPEVEAPHGPPPEGSPFNVVIDRSAFKGRSKVLHGMAWQELAWARLWTAAQTHRPIVGTTPAAQPWCT